MGSTWSSNEHQQYSMILLYNLENIFDHIATHNAWVMDFKISKLYHIWISLSEEFHWHFFFQCISLPSRNLRRFNMVTGCYCLSIVWKNHSVNLRSCAAAVWDSSWSRMLSLLNDCTSASKSAFSFLSYQNKHTSYIWLFESKCESASVAWYCDTTCIAIPMI